VDLKLSSPVRPVPSSSLKRFRFFNNHTSGSEDLIPFPASLLRPLAVSLLQPNPSVSGGDADGGDQPPSCPSNDV